MNQTLKNRGWAALLGLLLSAALLPAEVLFERKGPLRPGPDDGFIASATVRLLEQEHFNRPPFDDLMSSNLFHRYLNALDPQHMHFLESDVQDFIHYETALDGMLGRRANADTSPAFDIFERFYQRLEQRTAYAKELLSTETFVFEDTEPVLLNRRDAPYPAGLEEARAAWRDRLRYEYLKEKLGLMDQRKKDAAKAGKDGGEEPAPDDMVAAPARDIDEEVKDTLHRRYLRNLRFFGEWDSDDVIQLFLSTLARVYDPHSDYLGRAQMEQFSISMNLALFGIGAQLTSEDGYCTISRLLPGGPAEKSKELNERDRIVAVAQGEGEPVDVVDMSLNKVVQLIRGPKGTEVRLTIAPPKGSASSERRIVSLIRDEIPLEDQAAKARLIEIPGEDGVKRLGMIDLPSFYAPMDFGRGQSSSAKHSTSEDVTLLIQKLKKEGMDGLILDLRRNGGGSLEEAVRLTGLFIERGPVVQVLNADGTVQIQSDRDPSILYDGPMLVLTSRGSASASEIVAGALQDYGRALVVGDISTHGKGTVQSLNPLRPYLGLLNLASSKDPGSVKVTIRKFYRANGESTQLHGITPHIVLPSVANSIEEFGEGSLKNALRGDPIPSARFTPMRRVQPHLAELRERSETRVAQARDFDYIREDIARFEEAQKDRTVLLNEAQRMQEREEAEARRKARLEERKSRPHPDYVVYEITLADVDKPGLPNPGASNNGSKDSAALVDDEEDGEEAPAFGRRDDGPRVDPTMDEAKFILLDYIQLRSGSKIVTAGPRVNPDPPRP